MPYLKPVLRLALKNVEEVRPRTKAELNYCACKVALQFLAGQNEVGYQELSDAVNGLRDAADELKRRLLDPYEDAKRAEHGDLFR